MKGVPFEDVVQAYKDTGSVWKAGKRLGLSGQTVHQRLVAMNYPISGRKWSTEEYEEMARLAEAGLPLGKIADRLGRTYAAVAVKLSRNGIPVHRVWAKKVTIPRGIGLDKASIKKHLKILENSDLTVTRYARAYGLNTTSFVDAIKRHFPDEWAEYLATHSNISNRACEYCRREFVPITGKQRFCDTLCRSRGKADREYFGGKRRMAVGMAEGICQLCEKSVEKGLTPHHIYGKENDSDNEALIALCQGCHKLVTLLATRLFLENEEAWEALISLAWIRKNAADLFKNGNGAIIEVTVGLDVRRGDEEELVGSFADELLKVDA